MKFQKVFFKKNIKIFLSFFAFLLCFRIILFFLPFSALENFKKQSYSTRIFDKRGELIQILPLESGLRREFTEIKKIPKQIQEEFIKEEDKRFYFHFGVDFISIFRAFFQNVKEKRNVSGASTITMQLARMISPSEKREFSSKIKDLINAVRIEGKLSKKQILELYLNNIPFGKNSEGVTTAARTFYAKNLDELSEDEIKALSIIPRNPNLYNNLQKKFKYPFEAPHYVQFLKKSSSLNKNLQSQHEIKTSLDLRLQHFGEERLREALKNAQNSRISNAAILLLDAKTGEILIWIGSEGWQDFENGGQIDGILNKIQPGSSMKPFLYALALDSGFAPNTVFADVPHEFGEKNLYIPQNFNNRFNGPVRFRVALASSLNIPAVTLLDTISVEKYMQKLEELGFDSLKGEGERFDLSLSLGAGEVSLFELVNAFRVFVNDGKLGEKQIYSTDCARIICSILSDKNARSMGFGYSQTFETTYPAIFKTGTSNQYQNIVALGSTKDFTIGVWMGNFSGNTVIGKTGSSLPAFVAKSILDYLDRDTKNSSNNKNMQFDEPENFSKRKICVLSGKSPSKFCTSTVFEYIKNDIELEKCDWHKENGIFYPIEYQKWITSSELEDKLDIDYKFKNFSIKSPKNNSIFYFDESKKMLRQFVSFEAVGGSADIATIFLDEEKFAELQRPFLINIPATPGNHTLKIKCGEEYDFVTFEVR